MKKAVLAVLVILICFSGCVSSAQRQAEEDARIETQRRAEEEQQAKEAAEARRKAEEQAKKEAEEARKAKLVIVRSRHWRLGTGYALENWESAFPNKAAAEAWLKNILDRNDDVGDILSARKTLYTRYVEAFKYLPNKLTLAEVVKAKQNIVEAYNRFKPILEDVTKITSKGVVVVEDGFQGFPVSDPTRGLFYTALSDIAIINQFIDNVEKEYQKLVDMYPVN